MTTVGKKSPQITQEKTLRRVRLRLMVAIPLSFSLFTIASGYLTFNLSRHFFIDYDHLRFPLKEGYFWIFLGIFLITGLSAASGMILANAITAPLKKLCSKMETFIGGKKKVAFNELDLLNNILEEVFSSLERMKEAKTSEAPSKGIKTNEEGKKVLQETTEIEQIRKWLKQTDQMAGLGIMAAGIAHEIRNPLASIRGLMELLREDIPPTHPHRNYTEQAIKEADRMNDLVEGVLEFAQMETTKPLPQNINSLLKDALYSIRLRLPTQQLQVEEMLDVNLPPLLASPDKLRRAFENLILNAFEATPEGGKITISSCTEDGARYGDEPTKKILLKFHNTGSFIPPEDREKIFFPFYTTKRKGTGLGLPITHRIIASHGGQICVDSDKEKGTTFIVELPANY